MKIKPVKMVRFIDIKHQDKLTYQQKLEKYKKGEYLFPAPPVCTVRWDDDAWIKYIDGHKGWTQNT